MVVKKVLPIVSGPYPPPIRVELPGLVLDHLIARVVHKIGITARATIHHIRARTPIQGVVAIITIQHVIQDIAYNIIVQSIADPLYRTTSQNKMFDIVAQRETDRGHDLINAFIRILDHGITSVLHVVNVLTRAARQHVDAFIAADDVTQFVAGAVDVVRAGEGEIFEVVAQRE